RAGESEVDGRRGGDRSSESTLSRPDWVCSAVRLKKYSEMSATKKMLSSLGKDGQPGRGSEFVIPHLKPSAQSGFLGIKSGKTHLSAAMTYIGKEITADDVIDRIQQPNADSEKAKKLVEEFLDRLQEFKVGNVVTISYDAEGSFTLKLKSSRPATSNRKSLP
ncbi:hypothetical protein, partial [Roseibacillus persicicus]|uniref:hypothetical protein n=1 Tax=Roseibacillus persicicus TaxID=454148 RepID=UPI00280F89E8